MAKYRKKPVVIDAIQWTGNDADILVFLAVLEAPMDTVRILPAAAAGLAGEGECLMIKGCDGMLTAPLGHWLIRGIKGEFYCCSPDVFALSYDRVD